MIPLRIRDHRVDRIDELFVLAIAVLLITYVPWLTLGLLR